ncbi:Mitotic exit network component [Cystobasidiomycetes sp. EMM_F5]
MSFFQLGKRQQTMVRPRKNAAEGTKNYQLKKYAEATLGSGNLRLAVVLPEGEDLNEWLSVNTVDFFNQINMLYGTITEFCSKEECPVMTAGSRYEYHWQDGVNYKKPTKLSAPEYVDALMNWVQGMLDDEAIFPSKIGVPFPRNFMATIKSIVNAIAQGSETFLTHLNVSLRVHYHPAHINTSYRHFLLFVTEFDLVDSKELAPLAELNETILKET